MNKNKMFIIYVQNKICTKGQSEQVSVEATLLRQT